MGETVLSEAFHAKEHDCFIEGWGEVQDFVINLLQFDLLGCSLKHFFTDLFINFAF